MLYVTILEKGGGERRLTFDKDEVSLGRIQGNDIVLPKGNISKRHARIVVKEQKFIVIDLKSTNGTYVNKERISAPRVITPKDKVYVGNFIIRLDLQATDSFEAADLLDMPTTSDPAPSPDVLARGTEQAPEQLPGAIEFEIDPLEGLAEPQSSEESTRAIDGDALAALLGDDTAAPEPEWPEPLAAGGPAAAADVAAMSFEPMPLVAARAPASEAPAFATAPTPAARYTPAAPEPVLPEPIVFDDEPLDDGPTIAVHNPVVVAPTPIPPAVSAPTPVIHRGVQTTVNPAARPAPIPATVQMPVAEPTPLSLAATAQYESIPAAPRPLASQTIAYGERPLAAPVEFEPIEAPEPAPEPNPIDFDGGGEAVEEPEDAGEVVEAGASETSVLDADPSVPFDAYVAALHEVRLRIEQTVVAELDLAHAAIDEQRWQELESAVTAAVQLALAEGAIPAGLESAGLVQDLLYEITALGPIEHFLGDDSVVSIHVNDYSQLFVSRDGGSGPAEVAWKSFSSPAGLDGAVDRLARASGFGREDRPPIINGALADGTRYHIVLPPISAQGPMLTFRRPRRHPQTAAALLAHGTVTEPMIERLAALIASRTSIVVVGRRGSGRSTVLNALGYFVPEGERLALFEDVPELDLPHKNIVRARLPALREERARLFELAPAMLADRLIVGESSPADLVRLMELALGGVEGLLTTAYATSPDDLVARLVTQALLLGVAPDRDAAVDLVERGLGAIVHVELTEAGVHQVIDIATVRPRQSPSGLLDYARHED